jgi:hypothetical protein
MQTNKRLFLAHIKEYGCANLRGGEKEKKRRREGEKEKERKKEKRRRRRERGGWGEERRRGEIGPCMA